MVDMDAADCRVDDVRRLDRCVFILAPKSKLLRLVRTSDDAGAVGGEITTPLRHEGQPAGGQCRRLYKQSAFESDCATGQGGFPGPPAIPDPPAIPGPPAIPSLNLATSSRAGPPAIHPLNFVTFSRDMPPAVLPLNLVDGRHR